MALHRSKATALNASFVRAEQERVLFHPESEKDKQALRLRSKQSLVVAPYKGFFARREYWEGLNPRERTQHLIRTLSRCHASWIFSHSSAAAIYNLEVAYQILYPLHYQTGISLSSRFSQVIKQHKVNNPVGLTRDGACVTALEQTVIDCSCYYDFKYALPIADSALHQGLTTKARLSGCLESRANKRGSRKAKRIIKHADGKADNGGESLVRAVMIECGLPCPELQVPIPNLDKADHYYFIDFLFTRADGVKVALELDGKAKYTNKQMLGNKDAVDAFMAERQREASITALGIQVLRLGFAQASNPEILVNKLAQYGIEPIC